MGTRANNKKSRRPGFGTVAHITLQPDIRNVRRGGMTDEEKEAANNIFVHTNSGVGNKLVYLLTDGDTFNGETVSGMGQTVVRNLYWETVQLMPVSPDYHDLTDLLFDAADNLGMTSARIANIQNACEAVNID